MQFENLQPSSIANSLIVNQLFYYQILLRNSFSGVVYTFQFSGFSVFQIFIKIFYLPSIHRLVSYDVIHLKSPSNAHKCSLQTKQNKTFCELPQTLFFRERDELVSLVPLRSLQFPEKCQRLLWIMLHYNLCNLKNSSAISDVYLFLNMSAKIFVSSYICYLYFISNFSTKLSRECSPYFVSGV